MVILGFYYNFVLLEPILWTLFGVLFSYVALYRPKVQVVRSLVYLFIPSRKVEVEPDDEPSESWTGIVLRALAQYLSLVWRVVLFCVVPSVGDAESSVYFSVLFRLMFLHFYHRTILGYFPETTGLLLKVVGIASAVIVVGRILHALRTNTLLAKRRKLRREKSSESPKSWAQRILVLQDHFDSALRWFRLFLARLILPRSHFIASVIVLLCALAVVGSLIAWTVYAFSDEVVYMYRNIASVVRLINAYLGRFASYSMYVDKAYAALSDWITGAVMADSASAKTRDLYDFFAFVSSNQKSLADLATVPVVSVSVAAASAAVSLANAGCVASNTTSEMLRGLCGLNVVKASRVPQLGNATRAVLAAINQDLESIVDNPYCLLDGFWELTEYYHDELQSGGTISKGGDYLLTALNYLKDIVLRSGSISLTALGSGFSIFAFLFDSALQAVIYVTALFLLLQSSVGFYHYTAVLLHFVDPSTQLYRSLHRALRAILISSLKMAIFHAGFVWLLFSYSDSPLVVIPTIAAFVLGLVPVVSPVMVAAIPLPIFAYANDQNAWAIVVLSACFVVWWSVGTAIYAEIPDSSVWMTTFSVGLGISLFGPRGVIIGPAIATIPFALYGLGAQYITGAAREGRSTFFVSRLLSTPRAGSLVNQRKRRSKKTITATSSDGCASDGGGPPKQPSFGFTVSLDELIKDPVIDRARLFEVIMNTPERPHAE